MSHTNLNHRRTHNTLLISKLLSQRDAATPFTLVLDTLEQPAKPLVREYIRRANAAKTCIIFLGFETTRTKVPVGVDRFVPCYNTTPEQTARSVAEIIGEMGRRHYLLIIDSLHSLCARSLQSASSDGVGFNLTNYLSSLIAPGPNPTPTSISTPPSQGQPNPTKSLVAIYHTDIPLPHPHSNPSPHSHPQYTTHTYIYQPTPLTLLTYLATTLLTTHSLATLLAAKAASDRSLPPPTYGLDEAKDGVLIGLKPARFTSHIPRDQRGVVLELEHRRRSGRGVREWYFLPMPVSTPTPTSTSTSVSLLSQSQMKPGMGATRENVILLDDHPLFRARRAEGPEGDGSALAGMTFELGLTERQRAEREGVVLPYFDAQREGGVGGVGPGEGGRILYDIGVEDDFDEDEDEI